MCVREGEKTVCAYVSVLESVCAREREGETEGAIICVCVSEERDNKGAEKRKPPIEEEGF